MFLHLEQQGFLRRFPSDSFFETALRFGATDIINYLMESSSNKLRLVRYRERFEEAIEVMRQDVSEVDWKGLPNDTAYEVGDIARREERFDVLEALIVHRAPFLAIEGLIVTAVSKGQVSMVKFLVEHNQMTVLHIALTTACERLEEDVNSDIEEIVVWFLEGIFSGRLTLSHQRGVEEEVEPYVQLAINMNNAHLLDLILENQDHPSFIRGAELSIELHETEKTSEGVLDVLLERGYRDSMPEDLMGMMAIQDNVPAIVYLRERGFVYDAVRLLHTAVEYANTSNVLDYLIGEGLPLSHVDDQTMVAMIRIACKRLAKKDGGQDFMRYFVEVAIKQTPRHPLPIVSLVAGSGELDLLRLLLTYPGYNEAEAFLAWTTAKMRKQKADELDETELSWLMSLDQEEVLEQIIKTPNAFNKYIILEMPGFFEMLERRVAQYVIEDHPSLGNALDLQSDLWRPEGGRVTVLDYYEGLLQLDITDEQRDVLKKHWTRVAEAIANELLLKTEGRAEDDSTLRLLERLLAGGMSFNALQSILSEENNSVELLKLRQKYDLRWLDFRDRMILAAKGTEDIRGLLAIGVQPYSISRAAEALGKVPLLKAMVDEGLILDEEVNWESAKKNVFSLSRQAVARSRNASGTTPLGLGAMSRVATRAAATGRR